MMAFYPKTKGSFLRALIAHKPFNMAEEKNRQRFIALIRNQKHPFNRHATPKHFTATAFIVNAAMTHTLLIKHKKLGVWINPGGHCDDLESVHETALMEVLEETGLKKLKPISGFLDLHCYDYIVRNGKMNHVKTKVPRANEEADYDTSILVIGDMNEKIILADREVGGYKWVKIDDLLKTTNKDSFKRIIPKIQKIRARRARGAALKLNI